MEHQYEQILDVYDIDGQGKLYTQDDKLDLKKASPFMLTTKK
jgi:hypothetical protein